MDKKQTKCQKCKSGHIDAELNEGVYICLSCGNEWAIDGRK